MIAIIVPAHNAQASLASCLTALRAAACHTALAQEAVEIYVVLDACHDGSAAIVRRQAAARGARICWREVEVRNVARAHAAGAAMAQDRGARVIMFTGADSCVAEDWLVAQLNADVIKQSGGYTNTLPPHLAPRGQQGRQTIQAGRSDAAADAFRRAGGLRPHSTREEAAMAAAFEQSGVRLPARTAGR